MPLILEGLATTKNEDGSVNLSPMGPIVDRSMTQLLLRPYQTSMTYKNLKREGVGVFHVTDNVEMIAQAAVGSVVPLPEFVSHSSGGVVLADACRWCAFEVAELDDSQERTSIQCRVVDSGRQRDFFGFNRAKHAVIEAAILATRVNFLPAEQIDAEMQRLASPVEKTAGDQEQRAFAFLQDYIREQLALKKSVAL